MRNNFLKENVIKKLGDVSKAAEFFGCERQAIYQWPAGKPVPELRQLQLYFAFPGDFPEPDSARVVA